MMTFRRPGQLQADCTGVAAVEFATVAPVFLVLLMGSLDAGHTLYTRSVLSGAVEAAARSSALETGNTAQADAMVNEMVAPIAPGMRLTTSRLSYFDFSDIGRPERWTDSNGNDTCDGGEVYIDENRSGGWDEDVGTIGNGGANDVVVYEVRITYDPVFAVPFLPASWLERSASATAVRKNQPFALQRAYSTTTGTCTDV
jgi:hypothetical protein